MICNTTITSTLKRLLLAALLCFSMVYSQVAHASAPPSATAVAAYDERAGSAVDDVSADHDHASTSDGGEVDHPTGKSDGNCSTHCPSVFGMNGGVSESVRVSTRAELVVAETLLDGLTIPADQRPPRY